MDKRKRRTPNLSINRRLTFCAGHRVYGHETKCQHPHGHNYVVHVTAVAIRELDSIGRVIDFSVLKDKLGGWLDANWDHAFIFFKNDKELAQMFTLNRGWKHYVLPSNPTAENMAAYLLETICPDLFKKDKIEVTSIILEETENCLAEACK